MGRSDGLRKRVAQTRSKMALGHRVDVHIARRAGRGTYATPLKTHRATSRNSPETGRWRRASRLMEPAARVRPTTYGSKTMAFGGVARNLQTTLAEFNSVVAGPARGWIQPCCERPGQSANRPNASVRGHWVFLLEHRSRRRTAYGNEAAGPAGWTGWDSQLSTYRGVDHSCPSK